MLPDDIQRQNDILLVTSVSEGRIDFVIDFLDAGANIHHEDDYPLRLAIYLGDVGMARILLGRGANIHAQKEEPLFAAIKRGDMGMIELLLENGADIRAVLKHHKQSFDATDIKVIDGIQMKDVRNASEKRLEAFKEKTKDRKSIILKPRPPKN